MSWQPRSPAGRRDRDLADRADRTGGGRLWRIGARPSDRARQRRCRTGRLAHGLADHGAEPRTRYRPGGRRVSRRVVRLALDRLPSGEELCSQSTVSRLENLPDLRALLRLGRALVEQYCSSFRAVPKRIVLDIDDTFDRVHGGQQLRLFNAYYDDYGFQPIVVFDGEGRFVTALLRPGKRPSGVEIRSFVRRLVGAIRAHWPKVEILLRADSHYAAPEVFDWCRANRVDWLFGLAPNAALRRHVTALEKSTAERFKEPAPAKAGVAPNRGKVRRFMQFYDAAESWSRVERIIARVEVGPEETDTRFIVTNLQGGRAKHLYERLYCARGQAENHIKSWKNHLAADRTSCHTAEANQFRLFLHAGAYWLLWSMRRVMPKRSTWRVMQFDTLRLRLIKIAARVVELKTQLKINLPSNAPDQAIFAVLLARLPRLVT